jgi:hypothetical protein
MNHIFANSLCNNPLEILKTAYDSSLIHPGMSKGKHKLSIPNIRFLYQILDFNIEFEYK